jgi:hypothetical protein
MAYNIIPIGPEDTARLRRENSDRNFFTSKADISGVCVKLYTEERGHVEMWEDNFYSMSEGVRSHARIVCLNDPSMGVDVLYDRTTSTAFLYNFDYYGWIKSIALAMASDILEDAHEIYSVHGAALDIDGKGVTLIAPSKTGKTTQSWGLLRAENARLVTDDWYFVRLGSGRPMASGSEKNCYIDADIGDVWSEYRPLVDRVRFDNKGRGIGNVRWIAGRDSVIPMTSMRWVVFLRRDPEDENIVTELTPEMACAYLEANDFCNPHQMVRDGRKMKLRLDFFMRYFSSCEKLYLVNTRNPAEQTQDTIRSLVL